MEKKEQIEILMLDSCTKSEAERHLRNGSLVFEDFEENFDKYMEEWNVPAEEVQEYKDMIEKKIPAIDWGIVRKYGKTYYIMYCL